MIHMVDPRQNRLFDPFQGVIPPAGQRIIAEGWQGVFRHALLEVMPVGELAENFSRELGAPTKELYSMAGLVFLADFFGWTAQEAIEVYIFRSDVQYALNLEPGVTVSTRSVERYQKMFRDDELAISVFQDVTTRLAEKLELDITCQRLDSTHVFSHMASFGRTKLMAVAIKRFLTQVRRHDHELYTALPEEFRRRYEPAESQLFSAAKDAESRQRSRQQAAEDLLWVIERFANCADMTGRSSYKALVTILASTGDRTLRKACLTAPRTRLISNGQSAAARTLAERRSPRIGRGPGRLRYPDARRYASGGIGSQRNLAQLSRRHGSKSLRQRNVPLAPRQGLLGGTSRSRGLRTGRISSSWRWLFWSRHPRLADCIYHIAAPCSSRHGIDIEMRHQNCLYSASGNPFLSTYSFHASIASWLSWSHLPSASPRRPLSSLAHTPATGLPPGPAPPARAAQAKSHWWACVVPSAQHAGPWWDGHWHARLHGRCSWAYTMRIKKLPGGQAAASPLHDHHPRRHGRAWPHRR